MKYEAGVHRQFAIDGDDYVYVTSSAAIVGLDDVSREVVRHFEGPDGGDLEEWESYVETLDGAQEWRGAFEDLVAMGLLRPFGEVAPKAAELPPMPYPLSTLVLNVTNKCNLSCTYCYEFGEDRIADQETSNSRAPRMSPETARTSIDFLLESAVGRSEVTVTFFGGETLLNFDTIREAVLYAEERASEAGKRIGFSLTTNATLLTDEIIDFMVEHRFGINVSIDGAREDHDRHRTFKSGRGSYDEIVPRIKKLIDANGGRAGQSAGRPIGARVTLTRGMSSIVETFRHLTEEIGFDHVGFAPVTSAPDRDYALSDGNLGSVLEQFAVLADEYVESAITGRRHGFSNIDDLVQELHQGINKAHPCGAGLGLLGVSTEGELGLCHRFVESGEHEIGNVATGIDQERREAFLRAGHISRKIACHECFARPHCSGGCYHEAYVRYSDAAQPNLHYCEWIRAWTDLGLRTYGRIANANPSFLERFETAEVSS